MNTCRFSSFYSGNFLVLDVDDDVSLIYIPNENINTFLSSSKFTGRTITLWSGDREFLISEWMKLKDKTRENRTVLNFDFSIIWWCFGIVEHFIANTVSPLEVFIIKLSVHKCKCVSIYSKSFSVPSVFFFAFLFLFLLSPWSCLFSSE